MSRAALPTTTYRTPRSVETPPLPILDRMALRDGDPIYFYELHEGDEDVFFDILLAHDAEYDEQEFLELVLEARTAVIETYQEDTLWQN